MNPPTEMRGSPKLATAVLHGAPFLLSTIAVAPVAGRLPGLPELALGIGSFLALTVAALAGDPEALRRVAEALVDLGGINRAAMGRMDENAKRLGNAGAWAVVFLALCALGLSVAVVGRLRRRVVEPLERIHAAVTDEHRERRCHVAGGSRELARIGKEIDRLLDDFERVDRSTRAPAGGPERPLLLALLETRGQPAVIADGAGRPVAANRAAQELLLGEDGPRLRRLLEEPAGDGPGAARWSVASLGYEGYRLCTLETPSSEAEERP